MSTSSEAAQLATPVATGVGAPVRRLEDERILRGQARYLDDVERTGLAHLAFVRSPHPHARILGIESRVSDAFVLTADDLRGRVRALPIDPVEGAELADEPHPVLADAEVRYVGQPVAAVVAESRALAEDAAEAIRVEYEPLEPVVDASRSTRTLMRWSKSSGDVDGAFARAHHVVRESFVIPRLVASPIEPRGAIAEDDPGAGVLTMWISAQDPHRQLAGLSHVLERPDDRIRVIVPDVGGAFGSKGVVSPEACATALAATLLGRPVKWTEDRLENFLAAYQGRGLTAEVELALTRAGDFLAIRARLVSDLGAYLYPTTGIASHTTAMLMTGCYAIPAADVELVGRLTNKVPTGPYRGAGRPEAALLVERIVDVAAAELGLDAVEIRRRNLVPDEAFPYRTPLGWTYDSGSYRRCLDRAVELVRRPRETDSDRAVGTGYAMYVERAAGRWESARVTIEPSGRVVVATGSSPHGQGHVTTFTQLVAEELGVDAADTVIATGDSALVPRGVGTFASRSVAVGGSALVLALRELRERCRAIAAALLEVEPLGSSFAAADGRTVSLDDVAAAGYAATRLPDGLDTRLEAYARFVSPLVFSSGCYAAVAEVERATGRLTVTQLVAVDDAGRIVNPLLAEGQVIGGAAQGLGECLVEEAVYDAEGQPRTVSYAEYSLLTAAEMPPVNAEFVETPSPFNPLGAKGIGEGGTIGTLAAVANAVAAAVGTHVDPPFTAEKLWRALHEEGE